VSDPSLARYLQLPPIAPRIRTLARQVTADSRDAYEAGITAERYVERCTLKTARLFECACLLGRAGSGRAAQAEVATFGREIGLAFQLLDDVLDVTGPPERTGKPRGTDLLDGTVTLPLILAREEDPGLGGVELRELDERSAEAVCERIGATPALERVRALARERVEGAKRALTGAPLPAEERGLLGLVADGVVERYS